MHSSGSHEKHMSGEATNQELARHWTNIRMANGQQPRQVAFALTALGRQVPRTGEFGSSPSIPCDDADVLERRGGDEAEDAIGGTARDGDAG